MDRDLPLPLEALFRFPRSNLEGFEMNVIELFCNDNEDDERFFFVLTHSSILTHPYRIEFVFLVTSALRWSR